jgi:hypothetical protein
VPAQGIYDGFLLFTRPTLVAIVSASFAASMGSTRALIITPVCVAARISALASRFWTVSRIGANARRRLRAACAAVDRRPPVVPKRKDTNLGQTAGDMT